MEGRWKTVQNQFKNMKKDQFLIFLLVGILIVVIFLPTGAEPEKELENQEMTAKETQTKDAQEEKLKKILSQVKGVGKTEVMITYRSSGEKIVEKDVPVTDRTVMEEDGQGGSSSTAEREASEETIYEKGSDGSQIPYVVKVTEPEIAGVLIVAEGGDNSIVIKNITDAVVALFGVEAHKIKVMKMN